MSAIRPVVFASAAVGRRGRAVALLVVLAIAASFSSPITGLPGAGAQEPGPEQAVDVLAADVVFAIDDSVSMSGDAGYVKSRVTEMVSTLAGAGIDPRFGLVEFAGTETIRTPLTADLDAFEAALSQLTATNGNPEAGFSAVVTAMSDDMDFREQSGVCVVLVTDEDADVRTHTREDAIAAMASRDATFFGIVDTDYGTTPSDYGPNPGSLAAATDGAVYSLAQFRDDPSEILTAVTSSCAQRVIEEQTELSAGPDQQVAEGTDVVLAGTVPVTTRSTPGDITTEEILLDSYESHSDGAAGPVSTTQSLAAGMAYDVTITGTSTFWGTNSLCGASEVVLIPSPGHSATRRVTHDAEFQFAAPSGCTSDFPRHAGHLQVDVGDGFAHLEPVGGQPTDMAADHTYHYRVVGQGQPLSVRMPDQPLTDNSGQYRVTVAPADVLVPWDFTWSLVSSQGTPIELLATDTLTPTFRAVDDGTHVLRLTATDGEDTRSDEMVVTVGNVAPLLGAAAAPTNDDGLVMVSASITDAGMLDTHRAQVDWGDGTSSSDAPAGAQGAGWASLAAGHVYGAAGTYDIDVTIIDDDGGRTTSSTTVEVGGAGVPLPDPGVALWADDPVGDGIVLAGNRDQVIGLTHSNAGLHILGSELSLLGGVEYVTELVDHPGDAMIEPAATQVAPVQPPPVNYDLADYAPGGPAAADAGDDFHDMTESCGSTWRPGGEIAPGLYWVPCDVDITGRAFAAGPITIVATGEVSVTGRARDLQAPFLDGLAVATSSSATTAIRVSGSATQVGGYLYAPAGGVAVTGNGHHVTCGVVAANITVDGGSHTFDAGACGTLDDTGSLSDGVDVAAGPLLVPTLSHVLSPSATSLLPGGQVSVTATVDNTGATLVVPGLVALANTSGDDVQVTGAAYELEAYDIAADMWVPVVEAGSGAATLSGHPVAMDGVAFDGGDGITGTTIADQSAAAWAVTARVRLDAAQVEQLVDPTRTMAVRSRVLLDTSSVLRVRQTTRFGGNVVEALRTAGGNVADVSARVTTRTGVQQSDDLGDLSTGGSVSWTDPVVVAPAPPLTPVADDGDASYLAALRTLDRGTVVALARARGTSAAGEVGGTAPPVSLPVDVPVVTIQAAPLDATAPGETATWRLTLRNEGSTVADELSLSVDAAEAPATVTGLPGSLAPGARADVVVGLDVPADRGDTVVLRAEVGWTDASDRAYGPVGADGALRILLPSSLEVRKWVDQDLVVPHGQIPYVVVVRNTGDDELAGVSVVDQLEPGVALLADTVELSQGTVTSTGDADGRVVVDFETLSARSEATLRYWVDATGIAPGDRTVVNQAVATADGLPETASDDPAVPGEGQPTVHVFTTAPNPDDGAGTDGGSGSGTGGVDPNDPLVDQVSPTDGSSVTEPVTVSATLTGVDGRAIASWQISTHRSGAPAGTAEVLASSDAAPTTLAAATVDAEAADPAPVVAEATFDPTVRDNGSWTIRFVVVDEDGNRTVRTTSVVVEGALKLGRVVTTYEDLAIGSGGVPLRVLRTYDTLRRDVGDDLGNGWDLSVAGIRVQTNTRLGLGPWMAESCGVGLIFVDLCWSNAQSRHVTVTWPDGRTETFDFTPTGNTFFSIIGQVKFTPRPGVTSTLTAVGDATIGLSQADGHFHDGGFGDGPVYDPQQFLLTDRSGTDYLLDVDRGLLSVTDRLGNRLAIDEDGITSSSGPSVAFVRDDEGRIERLDGPGGADVTYTYDAAGDLVGVTDPNEHTTTFRYEDHRLVEVIGPDSQPLSSYRYEDGRLRAIEDAEGNETLVQADVGERTELVTSPDGLLTTLTSYDAYGNPVQVQESFDDRTLLTTYDYVPGTDLLSRVVDPDLHETTIEWNDDRDVVAILDAENRRTTYDYEFPGRVSRVTGPSGDVLYEADYDDTTWLQQWSREGGDPESLVTYGYDETTYLLESVSGPGEQSATITYNAAGLTQTITDGAGRQVTYGYDDLNRLTLVDGPGAERTTYEFDDVGNLRFVTDALGNTRELRYDERDRVVADIDAELRAATFDYDDNGNLWLATEHDGVTTTEYVYDGLQRLQRRESSDGTVTTYGFDPLSRLVEVTSPDAVVTRTYEDDGDLATETVAPVDGPASTVTYGYDASGLPTSVSHAGGTDTFLHDANGHLDAVTASGIGTIDVTVDPLGRLRSVLRPNGVGDVLEWDPAGQLAGRTTTGPVGQPVASEVLTFDAVGQRVTATGSFGVTTYDYDDAGRLATVDRPAGHPTPDEAYAFDGAGNRTSWPGVDTADVEYDAEHRLQADGVAEYDWDEDGRLVSRREVGAPTATTYQWDVDDRLRRITAPDGSARSFAYDGLGRRIATVDGAATTWHVWAGQNVVADRTDDGSVTARWTTGVAPGSVLASEAGGEVAFPVQDTLGSVVALTDAAGDVAERYAWDTYGRRVEGAGDRTYGFTGHAFDAGAGLHYARARWYDPEIGSFLSEDPLPAVNRYAYVDGDAANLTDPTGMAAAAEYGSTTRNSSLAIELAKEIGGEICSGLIEAAILSAYGGYTNKGSAGEAYARDVTGGQKYTGNPIAAPETGRNRLPDIIIDDDLIEVKNVNRLSYSAQIVDYEDIAARRGGTLTLFTRAGTRLSGPLRDAIRNGAIKLAPCLPG